MHGTRIVRDCVTYTQRLGKQMVSIAFALYVRDVFAGRVVPSLALPYRRRAEATVPGMRAHNIFSATVCYVNGVKRKPDAASTALNGPVRAVHMPWRRYDIAWHLLKELIVEQDHGTS
jgi:hypothetical protein